MHYDLLLQAIYPVIVPVCLNLLPKEGSAHILEPQSSDPKHMGLVKVTIPQFNDPTRSQKMYALFHIEDVYDSSGKKLVQVIHFFVLYSVHLKNLCF